MVSTRVGKTVLVVCHANVARSVIAHVLLEKMLAERGLDGQVTVRSAGVAHFARDGMIPSLDARLLLREDGIHLRETDLASTALARHPEILLETDLVIAMTAEQKAIVAGYAEADGRPVVTLRELAGEDGDIGDPSAHGEEGFRACRDDIRRCLERCVDGLVARLA